MKVLLVSAGMTPDAVGGASRYTREIYKVLKEREIKTKVITKKANQELEDEGVIQIEGCNRRFIGMWKFSRSARNKIEQNFDDYILHGCGLRGAVPLPSLDRKFTSSIHDIDALIYPGNFIEKWIRKRYFKKVCECSEKISVPSNHTKDNILDHFPELKEKLILNYYGIDTDFFKIYKQQSQENRILYAGRIAENKGIFTLLDAYENLKDEIDLKLVLVGAPKSTMEKGYEDMKKKYQNVQFKGFIHPNSEKLPLEYSKADVFVYPSEYSEGFGLAIAEAMACGTQPVVSDLDCFIEAGGDYAYYFEKGNSEDLAEKIKKALENPHDPDTLRRHVTENFNWKKHVDKLINIWEETFEGDIE